MASFGNMVGFGGNSTSQFQQVIYNSHGTPKTPMPRPAFHPDPAPNPFQIYFDASPSPPVEAKEIKDEKPTPEPKAGQVIVYRGGKETLEEMDVEELDEE